MKTFAMLASFLMAILLIGGSDALPQEGFEPARKRAPPPTEPPQDDLGERYPGLFQRAEDFQEELPEGCSMKMSDDNDEDRAELSCVAAQGSDEVAFEYSQVLQTFWWSDGNCCCSARRYLTCPKYVSSGGSTYEVVHNGAGSQCWTQAFCGSQSGICQGRCMPINHRRTVLVRDSFFMRWVTISYPAGCRCATCDGRSCPKNFPWVRA